MKDQVIESKAQAQDFSLDRLHGSEVKALGGGKIGGYLVRYSTSETPDLVGDYFTEDSELGYHENLPVLYHHGQDKTSV